MTVLVIGSALVQGVHAEERGQSFYYLLPPLSSVTINDKKVSNTFVGKGKMIFQKENKELIQLPKALLGARIVANDFQVDIKGEAKISLSRAEGLKLQFGSLHISTLSSPSSLSKIQMGNLTMSFQAANFLVFASSDQSEKLVKVIEGDVLLENPTLHQKTSLGANQATGSDLQGRLLLPYAFDASTSQAWWEGKEFSFPYDALPIAKAGEDQRVLGNIPVLLDGSKSQYETGDIFEWTLNKGPLDEKGSEIKEVVFDSTNIVKPLFTPVVEGEYGFSLQITKSKGDKSNTDQVNVWVGKRFLKPVAIFDDVPANHPNNLAITYLVKKNVLKGQQDEKIGKIFFHPGDHVNRAEILKTIFDNIRQKIPTIDELKALKEPIFLDVKPEHWFAPYVFLAKKMNLVKGSKGLYRPADPVLLVEALKIIADINGISVDGYVKNGELPYPDAQANAWYLPYLYFVKKYNLVDVDSEGHMNPSAPMSRAVLAELLYRLDSISVGEKRGFVGGKLKNSKTGKGVAHAEIYIYQAVQDSSNPETKDGGFLEKGDLYYKTSTKNDGTFSVSLPVGIKYYLEAISGNSVSSNRVITSVDEEKTVKVELEILLSD